MLLSAVLTALLTLGLVSADNVRLLSTIAFGSCNQHNRPQEYWRDITSILDGTFSPQMATVCNDTTCSRGDGAAANPHAHFQTEAFVWLGDVVYADTKLFPSYWVSTPVEQIEEKYVAQRQHAPYTQFVQDSVSSGRVLGVWDDHDYGMNDGGAEYQDKDIVQQFFLDFLDTPADSPRRKQKGLYSFQTIPFSPAVRKSPPRVDFDNAFCLILLDVRYFRDPITAARDGDMLGETQWEWLETTMEHVQQTRSPTGAALCAATLIGGGIQFMLDEKPTEHWGNFPKSRDRLLGLIRRLQVERVVFLSGDVHLGEIGMDDTVTATVLTGGFPLVEITSSGLTHSSSSIPFVSSLFQDMFPSYRRVGVFLGRNVGSVALTERSSDDGGVSEMELVLRVHSLEPNDVPSTNHVAPASNSAVAVELSIPLRRLEAKKSTLDVDRDTATTTHHYPETQPVGTVTFILKETQRLVFPLAKFHQLINMYVYGLVLALVISGGGVSILLWRAIGKCRLGFHAEHLARTEGIVKRLRRVTRWTSHHQSQHAPLANDALTDALGKKKE